MNKVFKYVPITDLLETIIDNRGKTVPTSEKGIPLIATNCIKHSSIYPTLEKVRYVNEETHTNWFRAHLEPNDILFVNKGTPGRVCLVPDPVNFCAAQDMMAFRCNDDLIDYKYLFAVLRSDEIQKKISNNHVGLVIPHLRKQDLSSILIPIRDRNEQELIGNFYVSISEKIELNNCINTELEAMAKTLYDYWFVQFDFPDTNGKPYKSTGGKMARKEELKREIPEGWESGILSDIANITMGQSPPGESYNEEGDGMIFYQGCTDFGNRYPTIRKFTTSPTRFAKQGDILLSVRAPVGTLNISKEDCCIGRGLACMNSNNDANTYLFGVMVNLKQTFDRRNASGTTFGSITKDDLFSLPVIIPNEKTVRAFQNLVFPSFEKQNKIELENIELASLRDWLLPMLMNGQVSVGEIEEELGMVAESNVEYKKS
jgi:type I restriction enzyme S subunit